MDAIISVIEKAKNNGVSDNRIIRAIDSLAIAKGQNPDINPFTPGQTIAEFYKEEGVTQYDLAETFDVSQGAIQKMMKAELRKKRHFVIQQDLTEEPRKIYLLEWSVKRVGVLPWES